MVAPGAPTALHDSAGAAWLRFAGEIEYRDLAHVLYRLTPTEVKEP